MICCHTGRADLYREGNLPAGRVVAVIADAGSVEHTFGRDHGRSVLIFVTVIHNGFDPRLYDRLGALVAGELGNIKLRPFQTSASVVQNGVQLTVGDVKILGIQRFPFPCPWKLVIRTSHGKSVVAHGQYLIVFAYDTGPHMGIGIF